MNEKDQYIDKLEKLIVNELYPIYALYHKQMGIKLPDLDIPKLVSNKKVPALLSADFRFLSRTGENPRKN